MVSFVFFFFHPKIINSHTESDDGLLQASVLFQIGIYFNLKKKHTGFLM